MAIYNVHGATLQFGSPPQTVAQLETITLPSETRTSEEFPTHDQATGSFTQRLTAALRTAGECSFDIIEDLGDATHDQSTGLLSLFSDPDPVDFIITLPDAAGSTISFSGWLATRTPAAMPANLGAARVTYGIQLAGDFVIA